MTIIKLTSSDLFLAKRDCYFKEKLYVTVEDKKYRLIFTQLYDNQYGLDTVINNETGIIYDDIVIGSSIKDIVLISPLGFGNILALKELPSFDYSSEESSESTNLYFDGIMYLENKENVYFPSETGAVYWVSNMNGRYFVLDACTHKSVKPTQEIKDNIKLV